MAHPVEQLPLLPPAPAIITIQNPDPPPEARLDNTNFSNLLAEINTWTPSSKKLALAIVLLESCLAYGVVASSDKTDRVVFFLAQATLLVALCILRPRQA